MAGKKHHKRKLRVDRLLLVIGIVCILIALPILTLRSCSTPTSKNDPSPKPSALPTLETKPTSSPTPSNHVSLFFAGDTVIHESVYKDAQKEDGSFDFSHQLDAIGDIAEPFDLAYYNQETILGGTALGLSGFPTFNSPQEFGSYMVSRGFNLVSTATNHSLDMGMKGIQASRDFWDKQSNVITDGTNTSPEQQNSIAHMTVNGVSIALVSYTFSTNNIEPEQPWEVNTYLGHVDEMLTKVKAAQEQYDCVIAAMHWGTEYDNEVNQEQLDLSQRLADAGANIIIGNHPHVIQPFKWINGSTPCFYAMGNLISTQTETENLIGMIGALDIVKKEDGSVEIQNVRADLTYTLMDGEYPDLRTNIRTVPFAQLTEKELPEKDKLYQEYKNIITSMDSNIKLSL